MLPELLSPAGSEESLRAALAGGADAVYFGGSSFSNRMRAKNFTDDGLSGAIKLCHDCGAKAYITVNTRIREREMDDVLRLCEVILGGEEKCDAVIMADLGLARAVKREFPHAVLHASTQTSLMSPADCAELKKLGFTRLVIPRELSRDEIISLNEECASLGFETEMFIHGAHCVSCSGQCLMSFIMGGRSGNRGECAQPCRLPYKTPDQLSEYPLSLADMCLGGRMTDVISSGVSSLKIEGRLKSAPYVYGVTKIYRDLLDERRNASEREIRALSDLFSRGFTDGYFTKKYFTMSEHSPEISDKSGKKSGDASALSGIIKKSIGERISKTRDAKLSGEGALPLRAKFVMQKGTPARLTLIAGELSASAEGEIPSDAIGRAADAGSAAKNLTKLGGTGFTLSADDIEFEIGEGLWLPASSLNDLRRRTAEALCDALAKNAPEAEQSSSNGNESVHSRTQRENGALVAMICESPVLEGSDADVCRVLDRFERIYVPHDFLEKIRGRGIDGAKVCSILPVYTPSERQVNEILDEAGTFGCSRVMCHTIGQVSLAKKRGFTADMSYRGNVTNSEAIEYYLSLGCESVMLSPEIPGGAIKELGGGAIVYGRLPLMTLSRCVICGGKCRKGNIGGRVVYPKKAAAHSCRGELTDRLGEKFPVFAGSDCVNVVYNARPNYAGDALSQVRGAEQLWFVFTDETPADAAEIIEKFDRAEPLGVSVRRI